MVEARRPSGGLSLETIARLGGGLGEQPEACVVRELLEETGYVVDLVDIGLAMMRN